MSPAEVICQNPAQGKGVDLAGLAKYNLASRRDQNGMRHWPWPGFIEGFCERVLILTRENIIEVRGMMLAQGFEGLGGIFGFIDGNGDHFKVTLAIHPVDQHKISHFSHAGAAPGGPNVDEPVVFRVVFGKIFDDL